MSGILFDWVHKDFAGCIEGRKSDVLRRWMEGDVRAMVVTSDYRPKKEHKFLCSVPRRARLTKPVPLTGKIFDCGRFGADDLVLRAKSFTNSVGGIVLYDAGDRAMFCWVRLFEFAYTITKGQEIVVEWDDSPVKIFGI